MTTLPDITDAEMQTVLEYAQPYVVAVLEAGPNYGSDDAPDLIREHGRRLLALRKAGDLVVVLPARDDTDFCGVGVFDRSVETVTEIMTDDPAVAAGVFTFHVHPVQGFPGDSLTPAST
ncbi:hypothetical protein ABLE92_22270 [Gordonia sp. VNQ95]|uniref:hypothetical protein n=1 Tax=Gordonia sp. VNQ95 TaxID=3156619 RepID=UPI0032B529A6